MQGSLHRELNQGIRVEVSEQELKKALTPPGIKPAYAKEAFDIATDVMSIPGTYTSSVDDASDSAYVVDALKAMTDPDAPNQVVKRDTKFVTLKQHLIGKAIGTEVRKNSKRFTGLWVRT